MASRKQKYLIFMFGGWVTVEESGNIIKNIREVMQTVVSGDELTFVTGNNVVIILWRDTYLAMVKLTDQHLTQDWLKNYPNN